MPPVRRLTVSEFIRESKPDWKHVSEVRPRGPVQPYSGPLQVHLLDPDSFEAQAARQKRQAAGEEEGLTFWGDERPLEEVPEVEEAPDKTPGSSVPRG